MSEAWTHERPTKPGWYWRRTPTCKDDPKIGLVRNGCVHFTSGMTIEVDALDGSGEWQPVEPPRE